MDHNNLCLGCMVDKDEQRICLACGYSAGAGPESLLHLPPGTVLQGKYLIGRALGQGGFGITYLAWDLTLNLKLAIKEYMPQHLATRASSDHKVTVYKAALREEFNYGLTRFLDEARTLARFNEHPNIVTVRDYFEANNTAYLIMNYYQGVTLQTYLKRQGGKISFARAVDLFMPVLDALKEVHASGIMHRDISPDNILISEKGRVILIDFGAARQAVTEHSKSMSVILKAGYSPPEQYQSRGKQGPWTDLYAVAATMYRSITGQPPLEAIDRMAIDDLVPPSQLGVTIDEQAERALLKGLQVKVEDRFQAVEEFQAALTEEETEAVRPSSPAGGQDDGLGEKPAAGDKSEPERKHGRGKPEKEAEKKAPEMRNTPPPPLDQEESRQDQSPLSLNKNTVNYLAIGAFCLVLLLGGVSYFSGEAGPELDSHSESGDTEQAGVDGETVDPTVLAGLDADYYFDYKNGNIPLGDLPIGSRVVDPSWEWEFRTGMDYTQETGDVNKPVTWIVVAKDHYDGLESHVTLLTEGQIGRFTFDSSGCNHWGESGTGNATRGLRLWLNSTGIHSDEGFYRAFSEKFKNTVLSTTLPNREWGNGAVYSTEDHVFLPSSTELGDSTHNYTYPIGSVYPYFSGASSAKRIALLGGVARWYWTRSPDVYNDYRARSINSAGEFRYSFAKAGNRGVRPALNLKPETMLSEAIH